MKLLLIRGMLLFCSIAYGQWNKSAFILNSTLLDVAISANGNIYAVGTDSTNHFQNGAIFYSSNGGHSWQNVFVVTDTTSVGSYMTRVIVLDSNNAIVSNRKPLLYSTANNGQSWATSTIPATTGVITDALFFIDKNVGFLGNHYGEIFKTIDGGHNWSRVHTNPIFNAISDISCPTDSICYARTTAPNNLLKSENGGDSWTIVTNAPHTYLSGGLAAVNKDTVIMVTANSMIFKSANGGINWDTIACPVNSDLLDVAFINNKGFIVGDSETIISTTDYGDSWSIDLHDSMSTERINTIEMFNDTTAIAGSNAGSIYRIGAFKSMNNNELDDISYILFPNPINSKLNILFTKPFTGDVILYDSLGKIILESKILSQSRVIINLSKKNSSHLYVSVIDQNSRRIINKQIISID